MSRFSLLSKLVTLFGTLPVCAYASMVPITFEDALKEILGRSTSLRTQEFRIEETAIRNTSEDLFFLPKISASGTRRSSMGGPGMSRKGSSSASISAELNLFRFGADIQAWKLNRAEEREQQAELEARYLDTEREATDILINYIQKTQELKIIGKIIGRQTDSLKKAQEQFDAGTLAIQELDRIMVDVLNAKSSLRNAQISGVFAGADLTRLLGHENIVVDWPWKVSLGESWERLKEIAFALENIPRWRLAQVRVSKLEEQVSKKFRSALPNLDARFDYGINDDRANSSPNWTASMTLSLPLFDRLEKVSDARGDLRVKKIAEVELEEAARRARSQYLRSRNSFLTAVESTQERERTLETSLKIYEENVKLFRAGKIKANDLIIDQNRLSSSELFALGGWAELHRSYVRFCHALGRRVLECL